MTKKLEESCVVTVRVGDDSIRDINIKKDNKKKAFLGEIENFEDILLHLGKAKEIS
jgi:hypothetical protein